MTGTNGEPKVLIWDIETTNLNASFGTVLAIAYKWLGDNKTHVMTILDYSKKGMLDDKPLIEDFKEIYSQAHYTVAHYGKRFDLRMIQTKCLKHKLGPLPEIPMMDTCDTAWRNFKLHSNRLGAWIEYLGCKHEKMPMRTDDWLHAAHGCPKAMKAVKLRAQEDVLGLEEIYLAMRPWMKDEPIHAMFSGKHGGCISCGNIVLQRRGFHVSRSRRYQRYQCQKCKKWQRARTADKEIRAELV